MKYYLAYKLKKTINEIDQMPIEEYYCWLNFLERKATIEAKAYKK